MCGLFGWVAQQMAPSQQMRPLAEALAQANDVRGGDSWGYAYPSKGGWTIEKGLGVMTRPRVCAAISEHPVVMAHTRAATTGRVSLRNAHPFRIQHLIGAHNGVIWNHAALTRAHQREVEVDSEHIFHHLAEGRDVAELQGSAAVTYAAADDPSRIYLARSHAELAVARVAARGIKMCVWSSSERALAQALACAGLPHDLYEVADSQIHIATGGTLYVTEQPFRLTAAWEPDWADEDCEPDWADEDCGPLYNVRGGRWDDGSSTAETWARWSTGRIEQSDD